MIAIASGVTIALIVLAVMTGIFLAYLIRKRKGKGRKRIMNKLRETL